MKAQRDSRSSGAAQPECKPKLWGSRVWILITSLAPCQHGTREAPKGSLPWQCWEDPRGLGPEQRVQGCWVCSLGDEGQWWGRGSSAVVSRLKCRRKKQYEGTLHWPQHREQGQRLMHWYRAGQGTSWGLDAQAVASKHHAVQVRWEELLPPSPVGQGGTGKTRRYWKQETLRCLSSAKLSVSFLAGAWSLDLDQFIWGRYMCRFVSAKVLYLMFSPAAMFFPRSFPSSSSLFVQVTVQMSLLGWPPLLSMPLLCVNTPSASCNHFAYHLSSN